MRCMHFASCTPPPIRAEEAHTNLSRTHLSKFHRHTEPSAAHEARLRTDGARERVDWGWKTMAPTRSLCPRSVLTSSQFGTFHSLHRPLLKERVEGRRYKKDRPISCSPVPTALLQCAQRLQYLHNYCADYTVMQCCPVCAPSVKGHNIHTVTQTWTSSPLHHST